jgi:hypothetical protein
LRGALLVGAVMAIFLLIYVISRQTPPDVSAAAGAPEEEKWKFSNEGRAGRLTELRAKEKAALASYGWVDQKAGVVRLPIDRAMELTIRELNTGKR